MGRTDSKGDEAHKESLLAVEQQEPTAPYDDVTKPEGTGAPEGGAPRGDSGKALIISFLLMVVIGLGNKIFQVRL